MNDIEILEDMRDNIYGAMQFEDDYQVNELEEKQFNALNLAIKSINRVKELEEINKNLLDNLNHSIRSSVIRERLGIEENIPEEQMLDYIDIIVAENARLEDIEDKKVQIEYKKAFNEGVKSVENKIKEKIEEYEEEKNKYKGNLGLEFSRAGLINSQIQALQEVLEE